MKVIYCGERIQLLGGLQHLFKDQKGEKYYFKGLKGLQIGSCYSMVKNTLKTRPQTISNNGFELSHQDRLEYEAQKEVVKMYRLEQRRAMELKKPHPDIVRAIKLLKPFYRSLDRFDQDRFARYLQNQMSKRAK